MRFIFALILFIFSFTTFTAFATEYEVKNANTKLYSDEYKIDSGSLKTDSGTINAVATMSGSQVKVTVEKSSGSTWKKITGFGIYSNTSFGSAYRVAISSDLEGKVGGYATFSPSSHNYFVRLTTKGTNDEIINLYINSPIIVREVPPPSINSVSVSPTSADSGSTFTWKAYLSGSLPSGYSMQVNYGDGYKTMSKSSGNSYTHSRVASTVGSNRDYTVRMYNSSNVKVDEKSGTYTVTEPPETQYAPNLIISSANSIATQGSQYCISLKATDQNSNLKHLFVNWGDNPTPDTYTYSSNTSSYTKQMCHTYNQSGSITWSATVYDHTSKTDSVSKSISVASNVPTITSVSVDPVSAESGSTFTWQATLSKSLPSGYTMNVDFGDGDKTMNQLSNTTYSYSRIANTVGENRDYMVSMNNIANISVSVKIGTYTVTEPTEIQHAPSLTISSASSVALLGEQYCISLEATDQNGNLRDLFVNWGDEPTPDAYTFDVNVYSHIQQMCHVYQNAGEKAWSATVYDHTNKSATVTQSVSIQGDSDPELNSIVSYLSVNEPLVAKIVNSSNLDAGLSRSEAVVELDVFLSKAVPAFKVDTLSLINTFADVSNDDWYLPSLLRLAYYHGDRSITVITKENSNFRPFDKVSRQEFVSMVIKGLNLPIESGTAYIEDFSDFDNSSVWASWAKPYFNTAVKHGLIQGNNNYLYPDEALTIKESLYILDRAKQAFDGQYSHNGNGFYSNDSINAENLLTKRIGFNFTPEFYVSELDGIDISSVSTSVLSEAVALEFCGVGGNVVKLTVSSEISNDERVSDYYWWKTDKGYFRQFGNDTSYKTVCFFSSEAVSDDYQITVSGGDNIGYGDSYAFKLDGSLFTYDDNDTEELLFDSIALNNVATTMRSSRTYTLEFSDNMITKSGISYNPENIDVKLTLPNNDVIAVFEGHAVSNKVNFEVPIIDNINGDEIKLTVTVRAGEISKTEVIFVQYLPIFSVQGRIHNADDNYPVNAINIEGTTVSLADDDTFYFEFSDMDSSNTITLSADSGALTNHFSSVTSTLSTENPTDYIILIGNNIDNDEDKIANDIDTDDDNDGMPDTFEIAYGLNSFDASDASADFDNDSLSNLAEFELGTDPNDDDSDGDGIKDGEDADPVNTNPTDFDNDGMPNEFETQYGLNLYDALDAAYDIDVDGLTNLEEFQQGTDPKNADTDGDGLADREDPEPTIPVEIVDAVKLGDLNFVEPSIEACVYNSYNSETLIEDIKVVACFNSGVVGELIDLKKLSALNHLDMLNLTVQNWEGLADLKNLKRLYVGSVSVQNFGDYQAQLLQLLPNLKDLYIRNSQISDLSLFATMTQLESLAVAGIQLADWQPIQNMLIKYLDVSNTNFTNLELLPDTITTIDIEGTQVTDISRLTNMPGLISINLNNIPANIDDWSWLNNLSQLFLFGASNSSFNDLSLLSRFDYLANLYLKGTNITDWSSVSNHTSLYNVDLSDTSFSNVSLLNSANEMTLLNLENTQVEELSSLYSLASLSHLSIEGIPLIDSNQIEILIEQGVSVNGSPRGETVSITSLQPNAYKPALLSPEKGDEILIGNTFNVIWNNQEITGNQVDMYVLHDNPVGIDIDDGFNLDLIKQRNWYQFASNKPNNGYIRFDVSILNGTGNAYKILLISDSGEWTTHRGTISIVANDESEPFTPALLNEQIFYNVYRDVDDENGNGATDDFIAVSFKFSGEHLQFEEGLADVFAGEEIPYSITDNGFIQFIHEGNTHTIGIYSRSDEFLRLCWTDQAININTHTCNGDSEFFYFDKEVAQELIGEDITPTVDIRSPVITGQLVYTLEANANLTTLPVNIVSALDAVDGVISNITVLPEGPYAIGEHSLVWTASDIAGNTSIFSQTLNVVDTTAPVFDDLPDISIDAKGKLTLISIDKLGQQQAVDLVDGIINAEIISTNKLKSGRNEVTWRASDSSSNTNLIKQIVNINPIANFTLNTKTEVGAEAVAIIELSGKAAKYPVELSFVVSGSALTSEHNAESGIIIIEEGTVGEYRFELLSGSTIDAQDTVELTLTDAVNAVIGFKSKFVTTSIVNNEAPLIKLSMTQGGQPTRVIAKNGDANVKLSAHLFDLNLNDTHSLEWDVSDNAIVDNAQDADPLTFEVDLANVQAGRYLITATAKEDRVENPLTSKAAFLFVIEDTAPVLIISNDTDKDGINDAEEGVFDSDGDGIPDYKDNNKDTTLLPLTAALSLQTEPGVKLKLGKTALAAHGSNVENAVLEQSDLDSFGGKAGNSSSIAVDAQFEMVSDIIDFELTELPVVGMAVSIVIPMPTGVVIPERAIYRKFSSESGWANFAEDADNTLASAGLNDEGSCPDINSLDYIDGLVAGNSCIKATIVDGGLNDQDGEANGIIEDPAVIATEKANQAPIVTLSALDAYDEATLVTINSMTYDEDKDSLGYTWEQVSGANATFSNVSEETLTFTAPDVDNESVIVVRLTVSDGIASVSKEISIIINSVDEPIPEKSSGGGSSSFSLLIILMLINLTRKRLMLLNSISKRH